MKAVECFINHIVSSYTHDTILHIQKDIDDEIIDFQIMFKFGIRSNELFTNSYKYVFPYSKGEKIDIHFRSIKKSYLHPSL